MTKHNCNNCEKIEACWGLDANCRNSRFSRWSPDIDELRHQRDILLTLAKLVVEWGKAGAPTHARHTLRIVRQAEAAIEEGKKL